MIFSTPATRARNSAEHLEWIGLPLVLQRALAATRAGDEILGDGYAARGRQPRNALRVGVLRGKQPAVSRSQVSWRRR